jgi:DNA-binding HxlR family transcriptional regulator
MKYGQFCPIAKAMEVLGERWTVLIVRELLMGATRFSELQRGLSLISPSMLTKRLDELSGAGIVLRKRIPGQRGSEYFLTEMGRQLAPVVVAIGKWGMAWARGAMTDDELDIDLLMIYLQRSIHTDKLVGNETVIRFHFTDRTQLADWWVVVKNGTVELCNLDPGKEIDVYFTTDLRTMIGLWMGDTSYRAALGDGRLTLVGPPALTRNVYQWLAPIRFSDLPEAKAITA